MEANLILASASPRRRELLTLLRLPFDVTQADVDEDPRRGETPATVVVRLSEAKARAAGRVLGRTLGTASGPVVIACDTIVALEDNILGKPRDAGDATAMLRRLRGRRHAVHSAITLLDAATGRSRTDLVSTHIAMRPYSDAEVAAYVASGDPLDKAGAYAIQNASFHPVAEYRGCYANVVGLPLCHLARSLRTWEIEPLAGLPVRCQAHTGQTCPVFQAILGREK